MKIFTLSFFSILFVCLFNFSVSAQPGATCAEAVVVSSVPYTATGLTTVGTTYTGIACSGTFPNYMSGADYVFSFTPAVTQTYGIVLSGTSPTASIFVTDVCPDNASVACIANINSTMGNPTLSVPLTAGTTYFITISTVSLAAATTNFDILIDACNGTPTPNFTFTQNALDVTFTNTSTNASTYEWFYGDELIAFPNPIAFGELVENPTHTFTSYGDHEVVLIATNSCGSADTIIQTITLVCPGTAPVADFTYNQTGADVAFQSTSTAADSVGWYFGDEILPINPFTSPTTTEAAPSHTYTSNGSFTVTCIAYNECGSDTTTQVITITTVSAGSIFSENISVACFPIPAENVLNVNISGNTSDVQILLINDLGQIVYSVNSKSNNHVIDISKFSKGVYTINVKTNSTIQIQRILFK
ncbi:MAG: hypothetical protein CVU05_06590 [Bacteroidetes bacterium HGW-Bacteroidetes-21]|jgi:PKD repeat protein|nr:MAG: hypothetical protein CVU05_06590 [Bacteroidetes bacterium HGW-Bacteroidetes-21]